jgi:hypothetical protein
VSLGNGVVLKYILRGSNQRVHSIDIGAVERDGRGRIEGAWRTRGCCRANLTKSSSKLAYSRPGWCVDRGGYVAEGVRAARPTRGIIWTRAAQYAERRSRRDRDRNARRKMKRTTLPMKSPKAVIPTAIQMCMSASK